MPMNNLMENNAVIDVRIQYIIITQSIYGYSQTLPF
jgi:hypothetical protein